MPNILQNHLHSYLHWYKTYSTFSSYLPIRNTRVSVQSQLQFTAKFLPPPLRHTFPYQNIPITISHFSNYTDLPIPNLSSHINICYQIYTHPHLEKPKSKTYKGYFILSSLFLLLWGDIESNLGPMPNVLRTHPAIHQHRCKTDFIPCTIIQAPRNNILPNHPNYSPRPPNI